MTQQDLKHLRRTELREMLLAQSRENEELRQQIEQLREQQRNREIILNNAGSIADAAMQLNGVFDATKKACAQYTESIEKLNARYQRVCLRMVKETKEKCQKMEQDTREECNRMLADARQQVDAYWKDISDKIDHGNSRALLQTLFANKEIR